jgi:lambda family phage portal protein
MTAKQRIRVKAGSAVMPVPAQRGAPTARYLRGDRSGLLHMRQAVTRDARINVREAADRAAALAVDFIHNSGWMAGAAAQVLCDTIGVELKLNCRAQLKAFGYSAKTNADWCRAVEAAWLKWAWNPRECDLAGERTIADMSDGVLLSYLGTGEGLGVFDEFTSAERRRYGVRTGIKVSLVQPHRLPRVTREFEGLEDGVFRDAIGRAEVYRFKAREGGIDRDKDIEARQVIHVMDRGEAGILRGITPLAPALKVLAQSDQLADATLATALMQTIFAATINSPEPSEQAFQAIQALEDMTTPPPGYDAATWIDMVGGLRGDFLEVWGQRIDALKSGSISMTDPAQINHLGPGETFSMHTAATPGSQYLPFSKNLQAEMARCLGVTLEAFTGDHSSSSYSSVRMAVASIWPIVVRRRQRIVAPFNQAVYERWLEESIFEGRIPFKGGYRAFARDPEAVFQAEFQGPEKPSADPYKDAMASAKLMELNLSSHADEAIARGKNPQELLVQIEREIKTMEAAGIPIPFGRSKGGDGGPQGSAMPGNREPVKEDA